MSAKGQGLLRQGGVERHFKTDRSSAGVRYGYRAKQPGIYSMHNSCIVHGLQRVIDSAVSSLLFAFSSELCSVLNHSLYTKQLDSFLGRCTLGVLPCDAGHTETNWPAEHLDRSLMVVGC